MTRREADNNEAFKEFERAGWGARAETYGLLTGRISDRLVDPLLDAAGVVAGGRVLDVGTGPGYVARRASERGAVVTGVDVAHEMLALARAQNPAIRFLEGDAEDLPFPDRSFDALVGNLVINHLPRPEWAIREFVRVLAPGGGIALSTWDLPERNRFLGILLDALRACGVEESVAGPDPLRFADDDEFRGLLRSGGLDTVEVRGVAITHPVAGVDELWRGMLGGTVRTAGVVRKQPAPTQARIRAATEQLAERYRGGDRLLVPCRAKVARGRKP